MGITNTCQNEWNHLFMMFICNMYFTLCEHHLLVILGLLLKKYLPQPEYITQIIEVINNWGQ